MSSPSDRRGKYLGFVAHELKNPLSTALWSVDLLKRMEGQDRTGPRGEKVIDASLRALRRMGRLVEDFFTLERLQQGGLELHRGSVRLDALVAQVLAQLVDKDQIDAGRLFSEVPADLYVEVDPDLLRRGLRGMLELMVRRKAELRVGLFASPSSSNAREVALLVRADAHPLRPAAPEENDGGDPTGCTFGFALCEAVVQAHGGSIEERDDGLHIRLPAKAAPAQQ